MKQRIEKLRRQSIEVVNRISVERALLLTEFYKTSVNSDDPVPVQRAKAFEYILSRKHSQNDQWRKYKIKQHLKISKFH